MMNERELNDIWTSYVKLSEKITSHGQGISKMLDTLGERLILCPAEPRNDSPGCGPGGLVSQAITVAKGMKRLNDTFDMGASNESILTVGLFHEIGKVGTLTESYFLNEDENWRREKHGSFYKLNDKISKMSVPERSIYLLQHFGVPLEEEEFLAIRGPARTPDWAETRLFPSVEPTLGILLRCSRDILVRKL